MRSNSPGSQLKLLERRLNPIELEGISIWIQGIFQGFSRGFRDVPGRFSGTMQEHLEVFLRFYLSDLRSVLMNFSVDPGVFKDF